MDTYKMQAKSLVDAVGQRSVSPVDTYPKGRCLEEIIGHIGDQQRELEELSEHICNRLFGIRKAETNEGNIDSVSQVMESFVQSNTRVLDMLREAVSRL